MPMKPAIDDVGNGIKAAVGDAAEAYDQLVHELDGAATADTVLKYSAQIWSSSLKAWARLVLAPAKIAAAITDEST